MTSDAPIHWPRRQRKLLFIGLAVIFLCLVILAGTFFYRETRCQTVEIQVNGNGAVCVD